MLRPRRLGHVRLQGYHRETMNEAHFAEIEKALLYISEARKRAMKAAKELRQDGADPMLVSALDDAERDLEELGRRLMQQTYFGVPKEQLSLSRVEELTLS